MIPPPTPNTAENTPATERIRASRTSTARILGSAMADDPVGRLTEDPRRAAVLLDVDGTLAPIVERAEDARVPDETRVEVARLAGRYALVACVSGRPGAEVERMLGVDGVAIVGEHGLELAPDAERWAEAVAAFANGVDWPA